MRVSQLFLICHQSRPHNKPATWLVEQDSRKWLCKFGFVVVVNYTLTEREKDNRPQLLSRCELINNSGGNNNSMYHHESNGVNLMFIFN